MGEYELEDVNLPEVIEPSDEELENSKIKLLKPKQQRFIHLYLSGRYSLKEIADLLQMSYNGCRKWLVSETIKPIIDEYQAEEDEIVKQGLKALQMKALYKLGQLVDSKMDAIAYQAVRDILDRNGKKAPTKQEVSIEVYTFEQQMKEAIDMADFKDAIDVDIN